MVAENDWIGMVAMRRWPRFVIVGMLAVFCLSGCVSSPGSAPTPTPSLDHDTRQQMATECLDLWLNTEAPQTLIDAGMATTWPDGDAFDEPAITQDDNGLYHSHPGTVGFANWANHNATAWDPITDAIFAGWGCPYDPVVKAKIDQAEQECLDIWVNDDPPQAAIDAGVATVGPDGAPVQPVLSRDASGAYHADTTSDSFQEWVDSTDYYVPWDKIELIFYGEPCPYGPSPEQTPTATTGR